MEVALSATTFRCASGAGANALAEAAARAGERKKEYVFIREEWGKYIRARRRNRSEKLGYSGWNSSAGRVALSIVFAVRGVS
jgi:hypothetical protein